MPALAYTPAETNILTAATRHIPTHGFSRHALTLGAQDAGYLPATLALLPRGAYELVMFHLMSQRIFLKDKLPWTVRREISHDEGITGVGSKVRFAMLTRLRGNVAVIHKYFEAIALMSLPYNISPSLAELGHLVDEIWWVAGDTSVDSSWYTKRGLLSAVYAASETFMTQDQSTNFRDTEKFLDRRLEDVRVLGDGAADVGQFLTFASTSTLNVLRSWGVRI